VRAEEGTYMFQCPPTHADIAINRSPTDSGNTPYGLSLGGGRQSSTPTVAPRGAKSKHHIDY
jgi:hypothetical protein